MLAADLSQHRDLHRGMLSIAASQCLKMLNSDLRWKMVNLEYFGVLVFGIWIWKME